MSSSRVIQASVVFACLMGYAAAAAAQNTGIAGVVRDTSGAVIPGVTVEASSPVLIEKVRNVVTDDGGLYSIVDLRPGVYTVTFTLAGFSTVRREGIELSGSFTATVNAEMKIGSVEETITVAGQASAVDIRNVVQLNVLTDEVRESLPTGRSMLAMSEIIPGVSVVGGARPSAHDMAGTSDVRGASMIHGSRPADYLMQFDGTPITLAGSGAQQTYQVNPAEVQEYVYELGALSAENLGGGIRANIIPKEGGNRYTGFVLGAFSHHKLQSNNLTDALIAAGVPTPSKLRRHWDINGSYGGPIKRDKLWFFASYRNWGQHEEITGMYHAIDPRSFVFDPRRGAAGNVDLSRPAVYEPVNLAYSGRATWQVTPRNKVAFYGANQPRRQYGLFMSGTRSFEASVDQDISHNRLLQASWKSPVTDRLLFEAVWADSYMPGPQLEMTEGLADSDIVSVNDLSTGYMYRSSPSGYYRPHWYQPSAKAALSYVTGAHAAKFGVDFQWGHMFSQNQRHNLNMTYQLRNGVPVQITVFNEPNDRWVAFRKLAFFAQDQWTLKRLTVNGGVRLDFHNGSIGDQQTSGPNQYVAFQRWPEISNVPDWSDISPRLGVSYDLFGTGRTAVKATINRYVVNDGVTYQGLVNPIAFNATAMRPWTDANGDFFPQENELGTLSNSAFGTAATTTRTDDALREGWGVRQYNWESSASVQHQLIPQLSVNFGFVRRSFGNFTVTDNLAIVPSDFDEFCLTAPSDARLGGVSGSRICGLYDLNPVKRTVTPDNFRTSSEAYGTQRETWHGIDLTLNGRLPRDITISGGLTSGTEGNNTAACFVVDSPGLLRFCDVGRPWLTSIRFLGGVPLPWGFNAGVTFQSNPGPEVRADYTVTSAQVGSSVEFVNPGRTSFSGGSTTIALVEPGTEYADRMYQVDIRLIKSFRIRGARARLTLDLANVLNANATLAHNLTYGTSWLRPTFTLPGRLIKPGMQIDF